MKYNWRVLQLPPAWERTRYAGLRVEVLERSEGEPIVGMRSVGWSPRSRRGAWVHCGLG